jgi:hypothetical protein
MANSVLSYLLSLIGIVPITSEKQEELEEKQVCQFLTDSAMIVSSLMISEKQDEKKNELEDWLSRLSKMALCQILTSTIADYPQIADNIYNRHYQKTFQSKKKQRDLVWIQNQAKMIAHRLDNLRPSEQFGRAAETADALQQLVRQLPRQSSTLTLFGLIILVKESLSAPAEVRQHVFYHVKLGRVLILEMSTCLKNFKHSTHDNLINFNDYYQENWFHCLQQICSKLARFDVTWEYRKEYQEVVIIAERYYNNKK